MKKMNVIEQRRKQWLEVGKQIVLKCYTRESQLWDLCPQRMQLSEETKASALREIAKLSKEISQLLKKLADLERDQGFGFGTVLGHKPDELTTVVLSLMLAARLDYSVNLRTVGDIMGQASVRDPMTSVRIRDMFSSNSEIYPLITLGRGIVRDEIHATLRESTVNRILGKPSDLVEARCEAEALTGNNKRGMVL